MKGVRFFSDSLVMTEENESHRGQRERRGESESPSWRARNRGITEWKKREKERGGGGSGSMCERRLRPTPLPLLIRRVYPAWSRLSKQWCRGQQDCWVIEGEWAALSSTSAKNTSHTVTGHQVGENDCSCSCNPGHLLQLQ